jgi:vancomycin resistance protein YoaR
LTLSAGASITPTLRFDENRLAFTLKRIAEEVDLPPREGSLAISGLEVTGTPGQPGRLVNLKKTRSAIAALLQAGKGGTVDLAVEERLPAIMSVDQAAGKASALLRTSLSLVAEGLDAPRGFAADPATLRQWLSFVPTPGPDGTVDLAVALDRAQVTAFVQQIAVQLDRPAYDAVLDFDPKTNQVVVLQPSQAGQQLDVAAAVAAIEAAVMDGAGKPEANVAAGEPGAGKVVTLPLAILQPKVDSNRIAEMGIVEQVSEGTTYFKGSTRERVQNIVTAANKFRGAVIPPGEEFSFNKIVGDVTAANGFVDSLIIRGDRTETGVGGGVCQVSTTAFRAAFWGGFPVLERYPQGYVVSWYGEPGLDASIFTPDADFRFRNDTGHYLLIQPDVDTAKGRITFHFYGTKPDRTVEAEKPVITNVRDAPKPLYQEDATLLSGVMKQVDWAKSGMDVAVKRIITYGDGRTKQDKFVSKYRPWQAVYLYGPGTPLPPEAAP